MRQPTFHLVADTESIHVCKFDGSRVQTELIAWEAMGVGKAVGDALRRMGYTGKPLVLCISTSRCFAIQLKPEDVPDRDYRSLCFAIESSLPLDAENMVADFEINNNGILAVAAELEFLRRLLLELRSQRVSVHSITPLTLLAVDQYLADKSERPSVILCQLGNRLEIIRCQNNSIQGWQSCDPDIKSLRRTLMMGMLDNNRNATVSCFGLDASLVNQVVADTDWTVSSDPNWDLTSSAMRRADSVVASAVRPRLDLKRGELAVDNVGSKANYIQAAWLASFMLLIALNVGFWIRGSQYVAAANEQKTIQANIFEDLLPGQKAPVGILSRLESELLARQEQARKELDLRQSRTLLNALHELLVAL
ncbi:MAG: hypothetical protein ABL888_23400, partial [Pirellulaceae bacterium]